MLNWFGSITQKTNQKFTKSVRSVPKALTYAGLNTRPENSLRKARVTSEAAELERGEWKANSSLNFENLTEETKTENEESERSGLEFGDYQQSTDKTSDSFNFETFKAEEDGQSLPIILLTMMRKLG